MEAKKLPNSKGPYVLTGGDPAGISPEISIDAIGCFIKKSSLKESLIYFHTSDTKDLQLVIQTIRNLNASFEIFESFESLKKKQLSKTQLPKISILDLFSNTNQVRKTIITKGEPNLSSGYLAWKALEFACIWIEEFSTTGLLTAPLSKEWVDLAIKNSKNLIEGENLHNKEEVFSGHTGYLANRFDSEVVMLMHGEEFSVVPLTTHISIVDVPRVLKSVLHSSGLRQCMDQLASMKLFSTVKWAMCALNPHAGEGGLMGNEEVEYINEWCKSYHSGQVCLEGPFPSDTLFTKQSLKQYRLIFSCYHDQGLIPFKALEAENGVNCTIGLPFLRSSPDHGTAYNIAGQKIASSKSMVRAMEVLLNQELSINGVI